MKNLNLDRNTTEKMMLQQNRAVCNVPRQGFTKMRQLRTEWSSSCTCTSSRCFQDHSTTTTKIHNTISRRYQSSK
jgi:hypothetical protein